ncbi:CPBP family intramembrane metalloprotease (plasmid) [Rhodococcus pseudokoreensis]|uniref:CPBP family intramembrane metalloprotease n=1 Tax=Rhodococcus pseudokoreensis TaxID=2811421 RepID=A0A974VYE8_9NOCA|nr:CPBP family glutamic-type intramembrane protease [Rhodococcus pseudokoreensis]QSE87898.1 CPBP family intramembrane metalloprotease [Rhodococcus pseudokoreensis]
MIEDSLGRVEARWVWGLALTGIGHAAVDFIRRDLLDAASSAESRITVLAAWAMTLVCLAVLIMTFIRSTVLPRSTSAKVLVAAAGYWTLLGVPTVVNVGRWWFGNETTQPLSTSMLAMSVVSFATGAMAAVFLWRCVRQWLNLSLHQSGFPTNDPDNFRADQSSGRFAVSNTAWMVAGAWIAATWIANVTYGFLADWNVVPSAQIPLAPGWNGWLRSLAGGLFAGPFEEILFAAIPVMLFAAARSKSGRAKPLQDFGARTVVMVIATSALLRGLGHIYYGNNSSPGQHLPFWSSLVPGGIAAITWGALWGGVAVWLFLRFGRLLPLVIAHSAQDCWVNIAHMPDPLMAAVGTFLIAVLILCWVFVMMAKDLRSGRQKKLAREVATVTTR